MEDQRNRKSMVGPLLVILLIVLIAAILIEWSPLYYKTLISKFDSYLPFDLTEKAGDTNSDIRKAMKDGGGISFNYNYIPSERSWDTMYTYSLSRYSSSGDCSFYCTKNTIEKGAEDLGECLYSEAIWDELLSLILDHGQLVDTTSVYDSNGKVVSKPVAKTVSLAGGIYSPSNINEIEAFFKKLAVNAGIDASELDDNIVVDDKNTADKSTVTDLNGSFFNNPVGRVSDDEKQKLEAYLRAKYEETGVRMYIILSNIDDTEQIGKIADKMLKRATSPAMAFGITASEKQWVFRYLIENNQESKVRDEYEQIAKAYQKGSNTFDSLIKAIDKAYELY